MSVSQPDPAAVAHELLARDLPDRLAHVAGVAARANGVAQALGWEGEQLVAAAWLHDIGYAPSLRVTGFHPLDGARHLAELGYDPQVISLVAFHSGARVEAALRGLDGPLDAEFASPDPELLALLTYCDLTTGPRGQRMTVDERIADILERYDPEDVVHRSISSSTGQLRAAVREIDAQLAAQSQ